MKKMVMQCLTLSVLMLVALAGCGGGGDGTPPAPVAVLTISSQGTLPAGTALSGAGLTVNFPASVTVRTDGSGAVNSSVVVPSGVTAGQATVLPPSLAQAQRQLSFVLASTAPAGFGTGEFVKVSFDIVPGSTPQASDFSLTGFSPVNLTGGAVSGLTPTFTMAIQ